MSAVDPMQWASSVSDDRNEAFVIARLLADVFRNVTVEGEFIDVQARLRLSDRERELLAPLLEVAA